MKMKDLLHPKIYYPSIYEIDLKLLKEKGISGLLLDLDNTLIAWKEKGVDKELIDWINRLKEKDLKICIFSNSYFQKRRVTNIAKILKVPVVPSAFKPLPFNFYKACQMLNITPSETGVIGDQIFTDVLGGNIVGAFTILVKPKSKNEFIITKFFRLLERLIKRSFNENNRGNQNIRNYRLSDRT